MRTLIVVFMSLLLVAGGTSAAPEPIEETPAVEPLEWNEQAMRDAGWTFYYCGGDPCNPPASE